MTAFDELVTSLVTAGMTPGAAAALVARAVIEATAKQKTAGAARQARYRDRHKASQSVTEASSHSTVTVTSQASQSVTSDATKSESAPAILSSLSTSEEPLTEEKKERDVDVLNTEPRARKRGTRLPDDWQPSDADMKFAAGRGLRLVEVEIEATKFRNYWTNRTDKQAAKLNWSKAWQNWILNVRGGGSNVPRPGSKDDTRERTVNALRSLDPFPYADDNRGGESTSPSIPRQLSLVKSP